MLVLDPAASGQLSLERLGPCSIKNVTYKTLNGKALEASIVTPRNLGPGSHPVMVRWHGGGLVNGHRLYVPWFARYLIQYIQRANAIMVLPDYRLLPGASGLDILEDMRDFFMWMFAGGLAAHLDDKVGADLHDILISGESAGGWLALQSAFTQGPRRIRAVVAHSPMIDMRDSHWTVPDRSKYLGGSSPTDIKDLAKFFGSEEKVTTFRMPPDGGEIYHCLVREGLYGKVFGDDRSLYPLELLEEVSLMSSSSFGSQAIDHCRRISPSHRSGWCTAPLTP